MWALGNETFVCFLKRRQKVCHLIGTMMLLNFSIFSWLTSTNSARIGPTLIVLATDFNKVPAVGKEKVSLTS